jgi:hypothetical protein
MTICAGCKEKVMRAKWVEGQGWFCLKCAPRGPIQPGSVFPFTTFGIGDKPGNIEVQSLRHLRKLEAQFGVNSVAFNQDEKNFGDAPRGRQ